MNMSASMGPSEYRAIMARREKREAKSLIDSFISCLQAKKFFDLVRNNDVFSNWFRINSFA